MQGIAHFLYAVIGLLCLQELLAHVSFGLQALLIGENDLFLAFYRPVKAICGAQRLQKPLFCLFLPVVLASRPMDMCAKNSCIDSVRELMESAREGSP